jgi:aspartyl-tRNA(Asn)/glutamyl-tRNA(Gln) amidotransferase subunit C
LQHGLLGAAFPARLPPAHLETIRTAMSVDADTVRKISHLARIEVPEERVEPMAKELSNILDWVEQLGEVDTDGVEPLAAVIPNALRWREDKITDGNVQDKVLANAPKAMHGFFAVPKVIE